MNTRLGLGALLLAAGQVMLSGCNGDKCAADDLDCLGDDTAAIQLTPVDSPSPSPSCGCNGAQCDGCGHAAVDDQSCGDACGCAGCNCAAADGTANTCCSRP